MAGLDTENNNHKPQPPENHTTIISRLNSDLAKYNESFSGQFHLKIPKGVINTVDSYRDKYFAYLKDSVFKSNICYLLQSIDYQIWLYKIFQPSLSIENTTFYQLTITMGIIADSLATTILLDDLIEASDSDRSLGSVKSSQSALKEKIMHISFLNKIKAIGGLKILPESLVNDFQQIRKHLRNKVHIQDWEGRLYQSLTLDDFLRNLKTFREFLNNIASEEINLAKASQIKKYFYSDVETEKAYTGNIATYNAQRGFGFIECDDLETDMYFHIKSFKGLDEKTLVNSEVQFKVKLGKRGLEAYQG